MDTPDSKSAEPTPVPEHVRKAREDIVARFGCCPKATVTNCVCMYSFECPDHGNTHIGTHD